MQQKFVRDGVIYQDNGDGTATVVGYENQGTPLGPTDPSAQYEAPTAEADLNKKRADFVNTQVDTEGRAITNEEKRVQLARDERAMMQKQLNSAFGTEQILKSIRMARQIAQEDGGTGWQAMLSGVPNTTARRLATELTPVIANLSFGRLQQMRDESVTGGALGSITERELELLGSTVANLDRAVDLPTFLRRLDEVERNFIGVQLNALGVPADSEEGRMALRQEYGYTGVLEGETPQGRGNIDPNTRNAAEFLPDEYQAAHLRYLRDNWGKVDPERYTRFRAALDEAFDQTPNLQEYAQFAGNANQFANQGGTPESLGAIRAPDRALNVFERGINSAAQTPFGAAAANAGNAVSMGAIGQLSGQQDQLEQLRDVRPMSSLIGEAVGSGVGALAVGGIGRLAGAPLIGRSMGAETVQGGVYGATQDSDNPLRGAAVGAGGAIAGGALGNQVGKMFPDAPLIAGRGAMEEARNAVPTIAQVRGQAAQEFDEVYRQGVAANPQQTERLADMTRRVLARRGRVGGNDQMIVQDGATRQAVDLIESFRGIEMTPAQAQTVRETIMEGTMSPVAKERAIAAQMVGDFDQWAEKVMPQAAGARETASRYIRGQEIENALGRGIRQGKRQKGGDEGDRLRTVFGQLSDRIEDGATKFDAPTTQAIRRVAEGDGVTNALRVAGKFGAGNPVSLGAGGGLLGYGGATAMGAEPATGAALGLLTAAGGSLARNMHGNRTIQAAEDAGLTALGGNEFVRALEEARKLAMQRSGNFYGGLLGGAAGAYDRGF